MLLASLRNVTSLYRFKQDLLVPKESSETERKAPLLQEKKHLEKKRGDFLCTHNFVNCLTLFFELVGFLGFLGS